MWATTKPADIYFESGLVVAFGLFSAEILINSIVADDFKYSFFFWLDIIATLSLITDIQWILGLLGNLINATPEDLSVDAIPGIVSIGHT